MSDGVDFQEFTAIKILLNNYFQKSFQQNLSKQTDALLMGHGWVVVQSIFPHDS